MSVGMRRPPRCVLPAVGAWTTYPAGIGSGVSGVDLSGLRAHPFCRWHSGAAQAAARVFADGLVAEHRVHVESYDPGQSRVRCGQTAPPRGGVAGSAAELDAHEIHRLLRQATETTGSLARLTLTATGAGGAIGNEHAVLDALQQLAGAVAEAIDQVQTRVAFRLRVPVDGTTVPTASGRPG